jgi:phosphoribosylamine--glycine ligase
MEWSDDWAVTVVMASAGYPASSRSGDVITGLGDVGGVEVTHAGTAWRGGDLVTAGGRVLNVTGLGPTLEEARGRAFSAVERIRFDGAQYRPDIAARVAERVAS